MSLLGVQEQFQGSKGYSSGIKATKGVLLKGLESYLNGLRGGNEGV